jgi:hypothetical protein
MSCSHILYTRFPQPHRPPLLLPLSLHSISRKQTRNRKVQLRPGKIQPYAPSRAHRKRHEREIQLWVDQPACRVKCFWIREEKGAERDERIAHAYWRLYIGQKRLKEREEDIRLLE